MIVHRLFAEISDDIVQNIIVCEDYELANQLSRATYGPAAIAVECTQYPINIGSIWKDNKFFRKNEDGTLVEARYVATAEEEVQILRGENEELTLALASIIGGEE